MITGSKGPAEAGLDAMRRHAWEEAQRHLKEADAAGGLDAEGLRQLGKACDWCGDSLGCLDALERSYAAFIKAGDNRGAALVALMLRHQLANVIGDMPAARGWLQRAASLLDDIPECAVHGYLWRAQARGLSLEGKHEDARALFEKAIKLGIRTGDRNVVAVSQTWLGICLAELGKTEEGYAYVDEACASAIGGELGPYATGIVYCNTIAAYHASGEFAMGMKWSENATRWCKRESITGFAGICRVHRAEFMRLRGAFGDAEREARLAVKEFGEFHRPHAAEAQYEIGMIRMRMGDLDGADEAFDEAHKLGRDPQPGAALVLAARGQTTAALRSLETTAASAAANGSLDEMRCLAALAMIGYQAGDVAAIQRVAPRAEELAAVHRGAGLQALALQVRGTAQLALRDPQALKTLRHAVRLWNEIDAPFEVAELRVLLAAALRFAGDDHGARREIEASRAAFESLGALLDAERVAGMLETSGHSSPVARRTFFFSDVVGSTQLVEAIGDQAWSALVAWLDGSLRSCFESHGGEEVDHAGDGFFVAFPDSKSAVECAISIQRNLADHRRDHGFAPRLRIGLHAADASSSAGRYRGKGVHEASRIGALAGPDEILASRESVPAGFEVSEQREVTVKGLSRPLEIVRVEWR